EVRGQGELNTYKAHLTDSLHVKD
nr:hypothetical protein [Tanacetum cinerariifolium]